MVVAPVRSASKRRKSALIKSADLLRRTTSDCCIPGSRSIKTWPLLTRSPSLTFTAKIEPFPRDVIGRTWLEAINSPLAVATSSTSEKCAHAIAPNTIALIVPANNLVYKGGNSCTAFPNS